MQDKLFRKVLILTIIVLFVGANVVPSISGTISKMNDLTGDKRILNEGISSSGQISSSSLTFHTFDKTGKKQHNVVLPTDAANDIYDMLEELKHKIVYEPGSDETKALKIEFVDMLDAYGLIPKGLSKNYVLSLLNPSWLNNRQKTNSMARPRVPFLSNLVSRIIRNIIDLRQIFKNRFEKTINKNALISPLFADTATATFCSISSGGQGVTIPLFLLPRPRAAAAWSSSYAVTLVGELLSGKGFLAEGAQEGILLGFMGLGLTYAFPGFHTYGFIGYALYTKVKADSIEFFGPPNQEPVISDENPASGTWNVPVTLSELSFRISDADGDRMDYTVTTEPNIGTGSGYNKEDGVYTVPISGLEMDKWYTWTVEVTDGKDVTIRAFDFCTGDLPDVIFSDNFNDNIKDYSKWTEIYTEGTWEEINQRTEFQVNEYPYPNHERYEGIESSDFSVSLSSSQPVIVSSDMISNIGSTGWVGYLYLEITDGTNWIVAGYRRGTRDTWYQDSNDGSRTILNSNKPDGSWDNEIQIFSDRYKVTMDSYDSGLIYDSIFSSDPTLYVRIYVSCGGTSPPYYHRAGFDNVIVRGTTL